MRVVEGNQIGEIPHVRICERCEILPDLRLEFIQQRRELVISVREHVACICVHNRRAEAFHYVECMVGE